MKKQHAEIAGAGFAGLTAAAALAQRGWSVRVHEQSPECREFGAGIWLWENGLRVLNSIGAADDAMEEAIVIPAWKSFDEKNMLIDDFGFGTHETGGRMFCLSRQKLYEAVMKAALRAGAEIVTSSRAIAATPDGWLLTEDGKKYKGDLVIGADGVHSKVRDSLDLLHERRVHEDGAIRVLVPRTAAEAADPEQTLFYEWWSGHRRVLHSPCSKDMLYLCLTSLKTDREALDASPIPKETWMRSFPQIAHYLERLPGGGRWDVFETLTLKQWSKGRVAIVGDAAHGMVPGLGQGCGTAITNAFTLAVHLSESADISTGLKVWEERERPLTDHTQFWSWATWPLTRVPADVARILYNAPGTKEWLREQRSKPSMNVPYGTAKDRRWLPASMQELA